MKKSSQVWYERLERVVLGRDLVVVEVADEGDLLQDVGLHARDAVEEEDGENAGRHAEGGADGAPVVCALDVGNFGLGGLHRWELGCWLGLTFW